MKKRSRILLLSLILIAIGLSAVSSRTVLAQAPQPTPSDDDVNRVARQLYCPVCENISLDVCGTQACIEWRALIRQKLGQGWTDQQIKDYFAQQYGDRVLAEPPRRGLNWLVYVLPPVMILIGGVIVWRVLVSMRKERPSAAAASAGQPATGSGSPEDDPYLARLEEELRKKD